MAELDRSNFRKAANFRRAQATEWLAPMLKLARRCRAGGPRRPPAEWRKVLLLGADHIGDVLYRTVGLSEWKSAFPKSELFFAASRPAADLLIDDPGVVLVPADLSSERRSLRDQVRLIRRVRPDAVICYDSGAYARDVVAVALAGVPNCAGYVDKGFSGLVTHPVPIRRPQPFVAYFRDLMEHLTGRRLAGLRS